MDCKLAVSQRLLSIVLLSAATIQANPLPYAAPAPLAAPWPQDQNTGTGYGYQAGGLDVAGGASGTNNAFNLSTGGIVAICVVCALVVILGAASTAFYFIAKKRQWQVRRSIGRASRRITARFTGKQVLSREEEDRRARRHGAVRLAQGQSRAAWNDEKRKSQVKSHSARTAAPKRPGGSQSSGEEMSSLPPRENTINPRGVDRVERKVGVVLPPI